jgi:hypothetical protein
MSANRKRLRRIRAQRKAYEVVHGHLDLPWITHASPEARKALSGLHALVLENPGAAVTPLREWIAREPLPIFFNWLTVAYNALGESELEAQTVRENYRRNPHYLFARVNYAHQCLREKNLDGMREALGSSLEIGPLLGSRKRVHVSEVAAYFYAVALYHLERGARAAAEDISRMMSEIAWGEPRARELRRLLSNGG